MAVAHVNHLPEVGFLFMRQALVEARLMSEKRACDGVYVATLAEELRNIEKKITALEEARRPSLDESSTRDSFLRAPEDLPDAEWIHRKARELGLRLRGVEQASKQERIAGMSRTTKAATAWRAVPRYPKTDASATNRETYKGESKI
jgi:hypothetical protein